MDFQKMRNDRMAWLEKMNYHDANPDCCLTCRFSTSSMDEGDIVCLKAESEVGYRPKVEYLCICKNFKNSA
jgi:hypothetical protein